MTEDDIAQYLPPRSAAPATWCFFDDAWYLRTCPGVLDDIADAPGFAEVRRHYVEVGSRRGHSPNMFFDEAWYRRRHPDIAEAIAAGSIASGYLHYCTQGFPTHQPHWLYDDDTYALSSPDLTDEVLRLHGFVNRYDHYLRSGALEGRVAHKLLQPAVYRENLTAADSLAELDREGAFAHFLRRAWAGGDAVTSIFFDPAFFRANHAALLDEGRFICAAQAYLLAEGECDPLPEFSERFYLAANPDVAASVRRGEFPRGYLHFLRAGAREMRPPSPDIDLRAYVEAHPAARAAIDSGACDDGFAFMLHERHAQAAIRRLRRGRGHVDFYGYHSGARGWFFCGWLAPEHEGLATAPTGGARFAQGSVGGATGGNMLVATYARPDLNGRGIGVMVHIEGHGDVSGALRLLTVEAASGFGWTLPPTDQAQTLAGPALADALRRVQERLDAGPAVERLGQLIERHGYAGVSTLAGLREKVLMEVDETIFCPPDGIVLVGWLLADAGDIVALRLCCGDRSTAFDPRDSIGIDRPDVIDAVGAALGRDTPRCGFVAWLPGAVADNAPMYLEVETASGQIGHHGIPSPRLRGMAAIRFLLDRVDTRYGEVAHAFDKVLGPAVARLNADRLRQPTSHVAIDFGPPPPAPVLSVIVTLYGRLDFMEYQFAFLSRRAGGIAVELLYVLDNPAQQREAEMLAASVFARFGIAFRLLVLSRNLGFAPANNIGLAEARGDFVCFLNSDVFAGSDDWMDRMVARLRAAPALGAVGPLLLYEDDTVQHQGMTFAREPEFAGWFFPQHPRKGWRPGPARGLLASPAITGACMVMARDLAVELGGFDEGFVAGDFEDSDLCLRLAARGLTCAVDLDVHLYHLERQSQAGSAERWRMNTTLYNAWLHQRRWGAELARSA